MEPEPIDEARQQNAVTVIYRTRDGQQLIPPMKIFKAVGEAYEVATPVLSGYVLIDRPSITGTMSMDAQSIDLVYAPLGKIQILEGPTQELVKTIQLTNSQQASDSAPVELPPRRDASYFTWLTDHLGDKIQEITAYHAEDPTAVTELISLTDKEEEAMKMQNAAQVQTIFSPKPIEQQPEPKLSVIATDESNQEVTSIVASQPRTSGQVETTRVARSAASHEVSDNLGSEVSEQPLTILVHAFAQVAQGLAQVNQTDQRNELARTAQDLLQAIRKLNQ